MKKFVCTILAAAALTVNGLAFAGDTKAPLSTMNIQIKGEGRLDGLALGWAML